ncbi:MAG: endonuclease/exonuclease/phosphatase family protein [Euzebya sp.]
MSAVTSVTSWLLATIAALGVAVRLFGWDRGRLLVQAMAFYPYALAVGVVLLLIPWLSGRRGAAVVMTVALVLGMAPLVPRLRGAGPTTVDQAAIVRVAALNMLFGRADVEQVITLARQVDVLALSEVTPQVMEQLGRQGLDDVLPFHWVQAQDGSAGSGVWSRYPMAALAPVVGRFQMPHVAVSRPGDSAPLRILGVHTVPPTGGRVGDWRAEVAGLAQVPQVDVMLGDFNATLDHSVFRQVLASGYTEAAAEVGRGFRATWPAREFPLPGITIDHVLVGADVTVKAVQVIEVDGTDHRAVLAEVVIPPR